MIPSLNIDHTVVALKLSDSLSYALDLLDEHKLFHLPVVEENEYLGYLSEEMILNSRGDLIGDLVLSGEKVFTNDQESIYSSLRKLSANQVTCLAVLGEENEYLGVITTHSVFKALAEISAIRSQGAVISIVIPQHDYSLSELSRILEANGYKVLSVELVTVPNENPLMLEVIFKLNTLDITLACATMERYGYTVNLRFGKNNFDTDNNNRLNEILNYLNF